MKIQNERINQVNSIFFDCVITPFFGIKPYLRVGVSFWLFIPSRFDGNYGNEIQFFLYICNNTPIRCDSKSALAQPKGRQARFITCSTKGLSYKKQASPAGDETNQQTASNWYPPANQQAIAASQGLVLKPARSFHSFNLPTRPDSSFFLGYLVMGGQCGSSCMTTPGSSWWLHGAYYLSMAIPGNDS